MKETKQPTETAVTYEPVLSVVFMYDRGTESFCDNHGTKYWKAIDKNLKKWVNNYIVHYDNDLKNSKKYHCFLDYYGCIGIRTFDTDNFKEAVRWLNSRLKNYR